MRDDEINNANLVIKHFGKCNNWADERNHFFECFSAAEFHWFFVQGLDSIKHEFYVPGVSSLLNGFEASLRVTIAQVSTHEKIIEEISSYRVLSNNLLKDGMSLGIPVNKLAFPEEADFISKLNSEKSSRLDVEIVRLRNNICHGNIFEFINRELGPENSFFTPESLKPLAYNLLDIAHLWADSLGKYRRSKNLLHYD